MFTIDNEDYLNPDLLIADTKNDFWEHKYPVSHPYRELYDLMEQHGVRFVYGVNNMSWLPQPDDYSPTVEVCFQMSKPLDLFALAGHSYYNGENKPTLGICIDEITADHAIDEDTETRYDYYIVKVSFLYELMPDTQKAVAEVIDIFKQWLAEGKKVSVEDLK